MLFVVTVDLKVQIVNVIMMTRPTWDEYFLDMAELASTRSVCSRSKCGAVIVKNNNVISTGYNGAPAHQPNCEQVGFCYRDKNNIKSGTELERCRASGCHAENNAVALAAKNNGGCNAATIYIYGNREICTACKGQIANAGITRIVYRTKDGVVKSMYVEGEWNKHPIDNEERK